MSAFDEDGAGGESENARNGGTGFAITAKQGNSPAMTVGLEAYGADLASRGHAFCLRCGLPGTGILDDESKSQQQIRRFTQRLADALEKKLAPLPEDERVKKLARMIEALDNGGGIEFKL